MNWIFEHWSMVVMLIGWIITIAFDHQKITRCEKEIAKLWASSKDVDTKLTEINLNLTELNLKINMLFEGKVNVKEWMN